MGQLALTRSSLQIIADAINVKGLTAFYTDPFVIENSDKISVFIIAAGTTPKIKIQRQYSFSVVGVPDPDDANWSGKDITGTDDILSAEFTTKVWTINGETLKYATWMRYKLTANGGSSSNATITMAVAKQSVAHQLE